MAARLVAILTPDPDDPQFGESWRAPFEGYAALLQAAGARVVAQPWTRGPHPEAARHLALLAWGYHAHEARWRALLAGWPPERPLSNPPALLAWNTRKTYLAELERVGVATIPTVFADRGDEAALAAARARFGDDTVLVLKPQVSAAAHGACRVAPGEAARLDAPAMIQPFLPAVGGEGELSLFLFGGAPAHAVRKVAAPGDFRIQPQFGGRFRPLDASAEAWTLARAALAAAPAPAAYARVDMVRDAAGVLRVMEVEAIEPDLYLDHMGGFAERFVQAVLAEP